MVHIALQHLLTDFLHLVYPNCCPGCQQPMPDKDVNICTSCRTRLPISNSITNPEAQLHTIFRGRIQLLQSYAFLKYSRSGLTHDLVHAFKYQPNQELGTHLAQLFVETLRTKPIIAPDVLIPVPLHPDKLAKRGFNQAETIANVLGAYWQIPIQTQLIVRTQVATSQTRFARLKRWENTAGLYANNHSTLLEGLHIGLVDDVITTGATIEMLGKIFRIATDFSPHSMDLCN